jgi:hypothetical protein
LLIGEYPSVLFSFRFHYDNGTEKFYGSSTMINRKGYELDCAESSLFIDDAGGERISATQVGVQNLSVISTPSRYFSDVFF